MNSSAGPSAEQKIMEPKSQPAGMMQTPSTIDSDDVGLFEDSLGTLFGHVQPCLSEPGKLFTYTSNKYGNIEIAIPPQVSTTLFAHYVWRASMAMADHISLDQLDLRGHRVLELGAGTALPGILSVKQGSQITVVTDYDEPQLLQCIRNNVNSCCSHPEERKRARVLPLTWGRPAQEDDITDVLPIHQPTFTRILAADTIWSEFAHDDMLTSVSRLMEKSPEARFIVYCGFHTGRPIVQRFFEKAEHHGLVPDQPLIEHEVGGFERGWQENGSFKDNSERNRWLVMAHLKWAPHKL